MGEKAAICKAIENQKQKVIKEYDNKLNEIIHEDNPVKIFYLLAQTFGNTMEQGEIGIEFLKKTLTNDFFKEAEIKNGVNYIIFFNDDFNVMFSKSLSMEIKIEFKTSGHSNNYHPRANDHLIKLADLTEVYLNKKSFKNLKQLADYNCRGYKNNIISKIFKYTNTRKKCNKDLLNKIREDQENDEILKINAEEENELFNQRQSFARDFIKKLTDIEKFKADGWYISIVGVKKEEDAIN